MAFMGNRALSLNIIKIHNTLKAQSLALAGLDKSLTIGADDLAGLPEEQDPVWRRDVELETLRSVLDELGKKLQDRGRHL